MKMKQEVVEEQEDGPFADDDEDVDLDSAVKNLSNAMTQKMRCVSFFKKNLHSLIN